MRLLFGVVLVIGLGLAGFAVYMAQGYISQYQIALAQERAAREKQVKLTEIYVATDALRYGEQITIENARLVKWPEEAVPEGAFRTAEDLFPANGPEFRTILRAMEKDEPLLSIKMTAPGEDAGITSRLTRGMRAFAINVDVSSGVSGFLRPGDRVDVYWSGTVGLARQKKQVTKLIEANVRLIAIDQTADEDRYSPVIARTVTVEVSPTQVASLAQAQSSGKLSLSLVGAQDETISSGVEVDQRQLLGLADEDVAEAPEKEVCTIRTRRGADVVEIPIPCTN